MELRRYLRAAIVVAAAVILGSCTADGGTIYATIESEVQVVDNSLPNTVTVGDIVKTATNTYYVAVGALYKGILGTTVAWTNELTIPSGSLANALAYDGTTLWGGFVTGSGSVGLAGSTNPDSTPFAVQTDPVVAGKQVVSLSALGADLYAACLNATPAYELDYLHLGTWSTIALSDTADPIVGVAADGSGNYVTGAGVTIYTAAAAAGPFTASKTLATGDAVTGVFGGGGVLFATTKVSGVWYTYNGGTTWYQVAAPSINSVTGSLLGIAGPLAGGSVYVVGSDGFGYFTLSGTSAGGGGTLTRFSDSTIALYSASVRRVLVDGSTVFLGTNGLGLWRASLDGTGTLVGSWTHE